MENEQPLQKKKPRRVSKAFKKLRQKLHSHSSKNEKESRENQLESSENQKASSENDKEFNKNEKVSDVDQSRPPLPSSTAGGPKAAEDEEATPKPQTDASPKPPKADAEDAGIEPSNNSRHSSEEMKSARERDNANIRNSSEEIKSAKERDHANRKVPMQPGVVESPSITHTSGDGSISYLNSALIANRKTELPFTTPGYEWASRSRGYDWDTRRKIYGGNVLLGEHYERTARQRSEALERTYQKVEAQREQPIKVKATGVKTMIASGYWAGSEA
jgi:hypothetical protein